MTHHKGQLSSGFNYIFALIIGSIVFMFFVGFAYQYLDFAGSLSAAELVSSLDDEFAAFSVSDSAEKALEFSSSITFRVYEGQLMSEGQSKNIDHAIFSPFELEGDHIYIATKSLEVPYRVGNLFYITDDHTVYILVYDETSQEVVESLQSSYNSLPSSFPVEIVSTTQLSTDLQTLYELTASYDHVRFIFFSDSEDYIDSIAEIFPDYDILQVSSTLEDYSSGEVEFADGTSIVYISYPLLIGAMVSFDAASYSYNFNLVFEKLSRVSGVYYDKAKFLSARLPECDYAPIKTALNNYQTFVGDPENYDSYSSLLAKLALVEDANSNLGGDCPEVY
ncbi:hypothetical protein EXS74_03130 [Candidatus Woesearchaeota archaeon]|nr:hypothetical protein [Candidatus Woesearchaeota archaeon]